MEWGQGETGASQGAGEGRVGSWIPVCDSPFAWCWLSAGSRWFCRLSCLKAALEIGVERGYQEVYNMKVLGCLGSEH